MQIFSLYAITLILFLSLDAVGISLLVKPVFDSHIGHLYPEVMRVGPALVFYLVYVAGLLWFVSWPAYGKAAPVEALIGGAILGFLCYGTYEFTNLATLRDWSWRQVAVDLTWGTCLTAIAAFSGVWLALKLFR